MVISILKKKEPALPKNILIFNDLESLPQVVKGMAFA